MDSLIVEILPGYIDLLTELIGIAASAFVGGAVAAFLVWPIGYAIRAAMGLIEGMTR